MRCLDCIACLPAAVGARALRQHALHVGEPCTLCIRMPILVDLEHNMLKRLRLLQHLRPIGTHRRHDWNVLGQGRVEV